MKQTRFLFDTLATENGGGNTGEAETANGQETAQAVETADSSEKSSEEEDEESDAA